MVGRWGVLYKWYRYSCLCAFNHTHSLGADVLPRSAISFAPNDFYTVRAFVIAAN